MLAGLGDIYQGDVVRLAQLFECGANRRHPWPQFPRGLPEFAAGNEVRGHGNQRRGSQDVNVMGFRLPFHHVHLDQALAANQSNTRDSDSGDSKNNLS